jgi:hypothetical protein
MWLRVDADEIKVETTVIGSGFFTGLYVKRAEEQLSKQANSVARIIKGQILPSFYLSEATKGCVKANSNNLEWKKDEAASNLLEATAKAIAEKKLTIRESVTVINPFSLIKYGASQTVTIIFRS